MKALVKILNDSQKEFLEGYIDAQSTPYTQYSLFDICVNTQYRINAFVDGIASFILLKCFG